MAYVFEYSTGILIRNSDVLLHGVINTLADLTISTGPSRDDYTVIDNDTDIDSVSGDPFTFLDESTPQILEEKFVKIEYTTQNSFLIDIYEGSFNNGSGINIYQWDGCLFNIDGAVNITFASTVTGVPNTAPTGITNYDDMFKNRTSFNSDITNWDTSSVTSMKNTFDGATSFSRNLSGWDTSNVIDMSNMFANNKRISPNVIAIVPNGITTGMFDQVLLLPSGFIKTIAAMNASKLNKITKTVSALEKVPLVNYNLGNLYKTL
jgi:surface protein